MTEDGRFMSISEEFSGGEALFYIGVSGPGYFVIKFSVDDNYYEEITMSPDEEIILNVDFSNSSCVSIEAVHFDVNSNVLDIEKISKCFAFKNGRIRPGKKNLKVPKWFDLEDKIESSERTNNED